MPKSRRRVRKKAISQRDNRRNFEKNAGKTTQRAAHKATQRMPAEHPSADRTYKARLFAMVFSEKENLLELYNVVNGTHYEDTELSDPFCSSDWDNIPFDYTFCLPILYSFSNSSWYFLSAADRSRSSVRLSLISAAIS